jgi:hypothetical protein
VCDLFGGGAAEQCSDSSIQEIFMSSILRGFGRKFEDTTAIRETEKKLHTEWPVDAGSCEPLSVPNSLLTGKKTGNLASFAGLVPGDMSRKPFILEHLWL